MQETSHKLIIANKSDENVAMFKIFAYDSNK